jgi:peptidoglycan biosynthesis protein MviN/MurJ (putative lipid II flippase)
MTQNGTLRSIISVTFWKSIGLGLSVAIALVIANLFGAGATTDAFFLARRVTSNIAAAVERTFQFLQVPPLVRMAELHGLRVLAQHLRRRSWQLFLAAAVVCATLFALSPQLIQGLAPGFDDMQRASAVTYLRILLTVLPLSAATALSGATLNALRLFRLPVVARLLPRAVALLVLFLVPVYALDLGAVALGIAFGTVAMAAVFMWGVRRALYHDHRSVAPLATTATRHIGPEYSRGRIVAMLLAQFHLFGAGWIDMAMASMTGAGGIATLEFAQRMTNMTPGVVTSSVITVYYTEFSSHIARGRPEAFRQSVQNAMRATLLFVLPAALLLLMLNKPLVALLLGHGAFDAWAVQQTASIMAILAPLLVVNALCGTLASALFADPALPHLKIILSIVFVALTVRIGANWLLLPVIGILAVPLASLLAVASMLAVFHVQLVRNFGTLVRRSEISPFAAMAMASLLSAAAIWGLQGITEALQPTRIELIATTAASVLCGGLVFVLVATFLGVPELQRLRQFVTRWISRRGT